MLSRLLRRLARPFRDRLRAASENRFAAAFDAPRGLDTARTPDDDALFPEGGEGRAYPYDPSRAATFAAAMGLLPRPPRELAFVDVGSGKGRVLLLAAERGFRRVTGVELMRPLHEAAEANVAVYRRSRPEAPPIEALCADALAFPLPAEPAVYYLFNPFDAGVLAPFVRRVREAHAASATGFVLAYVNPQHRAVLDGDPALRLLGASEGFDFYSGYRVYAGGAW